MRDDAYEVEVLPTQEYDPTQYRYVRCYCVEATRWIEGEKGCTTLRRDFSSRWRAERFARSERRVARWFRRHDKNERVTRYSHGGGS